MSLLPDCPSRSVRPSSSTHPYGIPIIGWEHEMRGLTREDALSFYKAHYAPNNAVLVLAGDVSLDEAKMLVDATYAKVPANPQIKPRLRPQDPPPGWPSGASRLLIRAWRSPPCSVSIWCPPIARRRKGRPRRLTYSPFCSAMAPSSPSLSHPRDRTGPRHQCRGPIIRAPPSTIRASAFMPTPRPNVTLADLETALDKALADFLVKGIDEGELRRAKTRFIAESIYSQDSQQTLARMYGAALVTGSSIEDVRDWPKRIAAVAPDEIMAAARAYLDRRRSVTGLLVKEQKP